MSIDTHILSRTPLSAAQVRSALVHDLALADLGLVDHGEQVGIGGSRVSLVVRPWEEEDHDLIENGFETATVRVKVIPGRGPTRFESEQRIIAAILRLVLGDVCLAGQDAAGPDLLRLGGVVYVNPEGFRPENLIRFGHHPERIVVGILAETVEAAQ